VSTFGKRAFKEFTFHVAIFIVRCGAETAFTGILGRLGVRLEAGTMLARPSGPGKRIGLRGAAVLAALFLCTMLQPAAAQRAGACPPSRTPIKLNFKTVTPPPVHSHRLSLAGIASMVRSGDDPADGRNRTVGLTTLKAMSSLEGASTLVKRGDGFCVYLTSVQVDFGWEDMQVYVPSDYREGSCEYRAVLDHENEHVAIIRAALKEFAPRARARIESALAQTKPILVRGQNGSTEQALAPLHVQLSTLLKDFDALHAARSARIDHPSNYAAVTAMCKNWDGPIQK
jgi:hypothetical protein